MALKKKSHVLAKFRKFWEFLRYFFFKYCFYWKVPFSANCLFGRIGGLKFSGHRPEKKNAKAWLFFFLESHNQNQKFYTFFLGSQTSKSKVFAFSGEPKTKVFYGSEGSKSKLFYKKNEANLNFFKKFRTEKFRFGDYILELSPTGGLVASDHPKLPELPISAYWPPGRQR